MRWRMRTMRWNSRNYLRSREGETRVVRKFLFWPRKIDIISINFRDTQWRWLEFINVKEQVVPVNISESWPWNDYTWKWREIAFVEDEVKC